jgi:predicted secreted protein
MAAPACGSAQGESPPTRVTSRVGETFTITLAANHTTGYAWTLAQPPDPQVAVSMGSVYPGPPAGSPPGRGSQEVWTFRAVGTGETPLTLEYRRSFEPATVPAAQTHNVAVVVTSGAGLSRTGMALGPAALGVVVLVVALVVAGLVVFRRRLFR